MTYKLAINGCGRIGRCFLRCLAKTSAVPIEVVAINDLTGPEELAYFLRYDSTHGKFPLSVEVDGKDLIIGGKRVVLMQVRDPSSLPWSSLGIDLVIESTGRFTSFDLANTHINAGARSVIVSAPAKSVSSFVFGVNHNLIGEDSVISAASCTTNCVAPLLSVLQKQFGLACCSLTTVHAFTASQSILDCFCNKSLRSGRGALQNIIPSPTGAAKAVIEIIPELKGKLGAIAFRVPVPDVSIIDASLLFESSVSLEDIMKCLKEASENEFKGIIGFSHEDLVSSDILGNTHSCIVDVSSCSMIGEKMFRLVAWYDNEMGYSSRIVDLAKFICMRS